MSSTSSSPHCAEQAEAAPSQFARTTLTEDGAPAGPRGPGGPASPLAPGGPAGPGSPCGPCPQAASPSAKVVVIKIRESCMAHPPTHGFSLIWTQKLCRTDAKTASGISVTDRRGFFACGQQEPLPRKL